MAKNRWLTAGVLLSLAAISSIPLLKKRVPLSARLPFVYSRNTATDPKAPPFTQFKYIMLEEADKTHYRLSAEMMGPVEMEKGDRLCVQTRWRNQSETQDLLYPRIIFATGYSYPSQPPLPSGWAGVVAVDPLDSFPAPGCLLKKVPCSYSGAVISAVIEKKYFGDEPHNWSRQFLDAYVWIAKHGRKESMRYASGGDSIVNNYDGGNTFMDFPRYKDYNADKPTFLPPAVRK